MTDRSQEPVVTTMLADSGNDTIEDQNSSITDSVFSGR